MHEVLVRRGLIRGAKLLAFGLALLIVALLSLIMMIRSGSSEIQGKEPSVSSMLSGSYHVPQTSRREWLQRDLTHDDQGSPSLTLQGGDAIEMEPDGSYEEPGYTAADSHGNDLTDEVETSIEDDTVYYSVTDENGNEASDSRSITHVDTTAPEFTLGGDAEITISVGSVFEDPGYVAYDDSDGDLTDTVSVEGYVDNMTEGDYTLTYSVTDSFGNTATATRTVHVVHRTQPEVVIPEPGEKIIYLTFDDGPGPYTEQLLDILDKYGVKVTFFVTNQFPDCQYLIGEEFRRGHAVAIHSYSHDYAIYTSEEDYFADLNRMQEVIVEQTGQETTMVRFPGGSSNTISENYCYGIMSALVNDLDEMGYQYYDWNVASGDAGETRDTKQIIQNIKEGCEKNSFGCSVVLQHDIHDFSVAAVEEVIKWGIDNGYTFCPLQPDSPKAHHGVNN